MSNKLIEEVAGLLTASIDGGQDTQEQHLVRSAVLVAYERRNGGPAVLALMDRIGLTA